jgi:hypothetical protein
VFNGLIIYDMDKILQYFGIKIMNNIENKKCVYAKKALEKSVRKQKGRRQI